MLGWLLVMVKGEIVKAEESKMRCNAFGCVYSASKVYYAVAKVEKTWYLSWQGAAKILLFLTFSNASKCSSTKLSTERGVITPSKHRTDFIVRQTSGHAPGRIQGWRLGLRMRLGWRRRRTAARRERRPGLTALVLVTVGRAM